MENKVLVTESASNMRTIARQMLKGNWKQAVLGTLIYFVAVYVPTFIIRLVLGQESPIGSFLVIIYAILVSGALVFGITSLILAIHRGKKTSATEVFAGFEQFGRAFSLYFLMEIFILLWSIPFIALLTIGIVSVAGAIFGGSTGLGIVAAIVIIAAVIALILPIRASFAYSQCFFLAIDNPQMGALECLRVSKTLMNGNKWKYFCLSISFIGWSLLCMVPVVIMVIGVAIVMTNTQSSSGLANVFANPTAMDNVRMESTISMVMYILMMVASVGYLWLMPYMMVSQAGFYEILTGKLKVTLSNTSDLDQEALSTMSTTEQITESTEEITGQQADTKQE